LSEAGNGRSYYLQNGQAYSDPELRQPLPPDWKDSHARVFQLVSPDRLQGPEALATQLDESLQAITRITGQSKVDVLAHSMAGIAARIYRHRGGEGIGRLAMVATPNQGLRATALGKWAMQSGSKLAMMMAALGPGAGAALEWLTAVEDGNSKLAALNAAWPADRRGLEKVVVVGAGGRRTPEATPAEWGPGDGLVNAASLPLEGTPVKVLPGTSTQGHISLVNDRQVYREMVDFFEWRKK
jgi:hypothetical protein